MDVLIADDHPMVRDALATVVRQFDPDARVVQVGDYASLIEQVLARGPDLLLLDLNMPGMDGLEVVRHLKRIPETRDIPVIAFTGEQLSDIDYARGRHFDRIVHKSAGLEALENEIAGMIAMC